MQLDQDEDDLSFARESLGARVLATLAGSTVAFVATSLVEGFFKRPRGTMWWPHDQFSCRVSACAPGSAMSPWGYFFGALLMYGLLAATFVIAMSIVQTPFIQASFVRRSQWNVVPGPVQSRRPSVAVAPLAGLAGGLAFLLGPFVLASVLSGPVPAVTPLVQSNGASYLLAVYAGLLVGQNFGLRSGTATEPWRKEWANSWSTAGVVGGVLLLPLVAIKFFLQNFGIPGG